MAASGGTTTIGQFLTRLAKEPDLAKWIREDPSRLKDAGLTQEAYELLKDGDVEKIREAVLDELGPSVALILCDINIP
jgi:hypothetical protein